FDNTPLGVLAQFFCRAKSRRQRRFPTDGKILFYGRLCTRPLRRVRRLKRTAVALDRMPLRAGPLVRLVRLTSGRMDGIKILSCWGTHTDAPLLSRLTFP